MKPEIVAPPTEASDAAILSPEGDKWLLKSKDAPWYIWDGIKKVVIPNSVNALLSFNATGTQVMVDDGNCSIWNVYTQMTQKTSVSRGIWHPTDSRRFAGVAQDNPTVLRVGTCSVNRGPITYENYCAYDIALSPEFKNTSIINVCWDNNTAYAGLGNNELEFALADIKKQEDRVHKRFFAAC